MKEAADQLVEAAVTPFMKAAFRRRILEIRQQNEQVIDRVTIDEVLYAGFDASAVEKAQARIKDFRVWIEANKVGLSALQVLYAGTRPLRIGLKDLRQLRDALAMPPLAATPTQLWRAFQAVEANRVSEEAKTRHSAGESLADLVQLVRHAIQPREVLLKPYAEQVRVNYAIWLQEADSRGARFSDEQREWLDRMAEHIATSLAIEQEDFQTGWFNQHGSLGKAHALFGERLKPLIDELNATLAA
jgi:type I restriction enzyme R subunit